MKQVETNQRFHFRFRGFVAYDVKMTQQKRR